MVHYTIYPMFAAEISSASHLARSREARLGCGITPRVDWTQPGGSTIAGWGTPAQLDGLFDWIGLRENLQETIDFPIKYGAFL